MKKFIGSVILTFGGAWVEISGCTTMIVGFLAWLGILIWLATSVWGGLIWAGLWFFMGGGLIGTIVSLIALPSRLFGISLVVLGTRLLSLDDKPPDDSGPDCTSCGNIRMSEHDQYCRVCGAPYG